MKTILLLFSLSVLACSSFPKETCTDLSKLDVGAGLDEQKDYDQFNSRCQQKHQITVDRAEYAKHHSMGRKKFLREICTCEIGYMNMVRSGGKADEQTPTKEERLQFAKTCDEVSQRSAYTQGIELGDRAVKKFKPNPWVGLEELTEADARTACASVQ